MRADPPTDYQSASLSPRLKRVSRPWPRCSVGSLAGAAFCGAPERHRLHVAGGGHEATAFARNGSRSCASLHSPIEVSKPQADSQ